MPNTNEEEEPTLASITDKVNKLIIQETLNDMEALMESVLDDIVCVQTQNFTPSAIKKTPDWQALNETKELFAQTLRKLKNEIRSNQQSEDSIDDLLSFDNPYDTYTTSVLLSLQYDFSEEATAWIKKISEKDSLQSDICPPME
jgi:hypothetical protein